MISDHHFFAALFAWDTAKRNKYYASIGDVFCCQLIIPIIRSASKVYTRELCTLSPGFIKNIETNMIAGRRIIVHVVLDFGQATHATSLLIYGGLDSRSKPHAFYAEPCVSANWSPVADEAIMALFGRLFAQYNIEYLASSHLADPGLQRSMPLDYGSCQTWNMLFVAVCLLNWPRGRLRNHYRSIIDNLMTDSVTILEAFVMHIGAKMHLYDSTDAAAAEAIAAKFIDDAFAETMACRGATTELALLIISQALVPVNTWIWIWHDEVGDKKYDPGQIIKAIVRDPANAANALAATAGNFFDAAIYAVRYCHCRDSSG